MFQTQILVADDEQDLVWAIQQSLSDEGYEVLTAYNGAEALAIAHRHNLDLIILDISMPHLDGLEVCRLLRQDSIMAAVPILFLSARNTIEDRIKGLDEGSDDYLTKPFDLGELKARTRALLRRGRSSRGTSSNSEKRETLLVVGSLTLDLRSHSMRVREKPVELTPTEFDLIHHFMDHAGEVFSSQQLLQQVWGYPLEAADLGLVRWHVKNLRAKLEPDPNHPVYLRTVKRHGYMLNRRRSSK